MGGGEEQKDERQYSGGRKGGRNGREKGRKEGRKERRDGGRKLVEQVTGTDCQSGRQNVNRASLQPRCRVASNAVSTFQSDDVAKATGGLERQYNSPLSLEVNWSRDSVRQIVTLLQYNSIWIRLKKEKKSKKRSLERQNLLAVFKDSSRQHS